MGILAILLFVIVFIAILKGFPVAFTLGGISVLFGLALIVFAPDLFSFNDFKLLTYRIFGSMNNIVLMAIPLFIFMGIMLEKSGLAESLLQTMASLFGSMRGGLAISVIIVGALLAASTGIVGATVVSMGLISLPTMIKQKYSIPLATGTVISAGTLGIIIPPSIMLVLLADTINSSNQGGSEVDVGTMFNAALFPGLLLVGSYILYIGIASYLKPDLAPALDREEIDKIRSEDFVLNIIKAFLLPFILILAVLGSIFSGIASPTEAAAVGAMGSILLARIQNKLSWPVLKDVMEETTHLTSMVFMIFLGATTFTLMFRTLEGDDYLIELITDANLSMWVFLLLVMLVIFIAGFFIDFIEIIFIFIPVITPIFNAFDVDMLWVGIIIALNLQTSFITPPFGFSLFYLKGVAPPEVTTQHIYKGIIPFLIIQIIIMGLVIAFPNLLYIF